MTSAIQWSNGWHLAAGLHAVARSQAVGDGPFGGVTVPVSTVPLQPAGYQYTNPGTVTLALPDAHNTKQRWVRARLWGHVNTTVRRAPGNPYTNPFTPNLSLTAWVQFNAPYGFGTPIATFDTSETAPYEALQNTGQQAMITVGHQLFYEQILPVPPGSTTPITMGFAPTFNYPLPQWTTATDPQVALIFSTFPPLLAELRLFHR